MKKFFEISKMPLITAFLAGILFCVDALIAPNIVAGSSFLWVAFISWTITTPFTLKEKAKALIGVVIGFLFAVGMFYFGQLFSASVIGISIASLLGVIVFNFIIMYFDNFKKVWLNSISGIFMGVGLVFSGLGVGLSPNTWANAGIMLGVIVLYPILGMICAFSSGWLINAWTKPKKFSSENDEKTRKIDKNV